MTLTAHPVPGKAKSEAICRAFIEGAPKAATGAVFYGVTAANAAAFETAKASGKDWYYIDNSFFDAVRGQQFRVAKNRVQTLVGDQVSDGKRFDALGLTLAPERSRAVRTMLAVEQSDVFMKYVARDPHWLENKRRVFAPIFSITLRPWAPDKLKFQASLRAELENFDCVLTHSSAAAVTALLAGLPSVVSSMSALHGMPIAGSRHRYLSVLADNQWTLDEIRAGKAWQWLTRN